MVDILFQLVGAGTIVSNLIGGFIALIVTVWVSRREAKRQERQQRNNWYRQLHNICVRIKGSREIDHTEKEKGKLKEYAHLFKSFGEQINDLFSNTPDDVDLVLFNSMTNMRLSCIRYAQEEETANPYKPYLDSCHNTLIDYCLIVTYIIEKKKSPDIDYIDKLSEEEYEIAEKKYQQLKDGTLYEDEEEQAEMIQELLSELEHIDE